jgi:hypothetical protein
MVRVVVRTIRVQGRAGWLSNRTLHLAPQFFTTRVRLFKKLSQLTLFQVRADSKLLNLLPTISHKQ